MYELQPESLPNRQTRNDVPRPSAPVIIRILSLKMLILLLFFIISIIRFFSPKLRTDKTSRDCRKAVVGGDWLNSLDYALRGLEQAAGDTDLVAFEKFRRDFTQGDMFFLLALV